MDVVPLIERKRDGGVLADAEIRELIAAYSAERLPDYQMAALAMAIVCRGMTTAETKSLTQAMLDSGDRLAWPDTDRPIVDKHSTGGIGDKVSLVLAPLLAACGVLVPMISGRGLGATGGTLDKLESIPGYRVDLSHEQIHDVVTSVGCAIVAATASIAPADRRLYALRDVTGTVPSVPLITASILSKKLAAGLDCLVLDVKIGSGAFMKTLANGRLLAQSLVATATTLGLPTVAWITDMNQPLGRMVGNTCEVLESIAILQGNDFDNPVRELSLALGSDALTSCGLFPDQNSALRALTTALQSGVAYEFFERMVAAQGGDLRQLTRPAPTREFVAVDEGIVSRIDGERLGRAVVSFGGGRRQIGDSIDPRVGMEVLVRLGDRVDVGTPLLNLHLDRPLTTEQRTMLTNAFEIGSDAPQAAPLLIERIADLKPETPLDHGDVADRDRSRS